MTVTHFSNLSLYFARDNNNYKIKGLRAQNFSLQNKFLNSNSISGKNWKARVPSSGNHNLSLTIEGDYHQSAAQNVLKEVAFNNEELEFKIYLDNNVISGKFLISDYEISAKFDQFVEFEITLISSSQVTYTQL